MALTDRITVIIPTYNDIANLKRALYCLSAQTIKPDRVIVCDDCGAVSAENTANSFFNELNITYLRATENGGPGAARQMGLDYITNDSDQTLDWVMFMDSDDVVMPQTIEEFKHFLKNNTTTDAIFTPILVDGEDGTDNVPHRRNAVWLHGKLYNLEFIKREHISFPTIRTNEDVAFNLLFRSHEADIEWLDKELYYWHTNPNSITHTVGETLDRCRTLSYISSIYFTYKHTEKHNIKYLVSHIISCYNFYQNAICYGHDTAEVDPYLKEMLNEEEVLTFLLKPEQELALKVPFCMVRNDTICFYRQTYGAWLLKFVSLDRIQEIMNK